MEDYIQQKYFLQLTQLHSLKNFNSFLKAPCHVDMYSGPFEDTQFDAVVDVETSADESMDTGTLYFHSNYYVITKYRC